MATILQLHPTRQDQPGWDQFLSSLAHETEAVRWLRNAAKVAREQERREIFNSNGKAA